MDTALLFLLLFGGAEAAERAPPEPAPATAPVTAPVSAPVTAPVTAPVSAPVTAPVALAPATRRPATPEARVRAARDPRPCGAGCAAR